MIDFAHGTDVYKIWADMIAFDRTDLKPGKDAYCAFAGRRDGKPFLMDHDAIMARYGRQIKMSGRLPDVLATAMGNQMYLAVFDTMEELDQFFTDILRCREEKNAAETASEPEA